MLQGLLRWSNITLQLESCCFPCLRVESEALLFVLLRVFLSLVSRYERSFLLELGTLLLSQHLRTLSDNLNLGYASLEVLARIF